MAVQIQQSEEYLSRKQAAAVLGVEAQTMGKWACSGFGPKFLKLNQRLVRYRKSDVLAWIDSSSSSGK